MTQFHSDEYIEFLRLITPDNQHEHMRQLKRFNCAEDCPVFDGLFNFCQIYTAARSAAPFVSTTSRRTR